MNGIVAVCRNARMMACCVSVLVCDLWALKRGLIFEKLASIGVVDIRLVITMMSRYNI